MPVELSDPNRNRLGTTRDLLHHVIHPPPYAERQRRNLEAKMGNHSVEEHLRTIGRRKKGKPPSIAEVIMHDTPTAEASGKSGSLLMPAPIAVLSHPFGQELKKWEQGVDVDCGEDWTIEQIEMAIRQGPHRSALTKEAIELFAEDIEYQVKAGFSEVVLASDLMKDPPANLKVSPSAAVPQTNRRPRIILDLSCPVR
jgi:hypothetical protein